jgi:hypothetical protein
VTAQARTCQRGGGRWSTAAGLTVRNVGDVVENFTGGPPGAGNLPQGKVSDGVGPHTSADFKGDLCYIAAVEPEARGPVLKRCPFACIVERNTCVRSPGPDVNITRSGGQPAALAREG